MGSGAVQEQNVADGAARQLFIHYASPRGRRLGSGTAICPAGCGFPVAPDSPLPVYVHFRFELFELLMLQQGIYKRRRLHSDTTPWKAE